MKRPRIAVSGASGTGKTTLARALAARLGVAYLEEGMRRRLEGGLDLHALGPAEHRALTEVLLDEMLEAMAAARRDPGGHVCDRSPLDMCAFWLYYHFVYAQAATEAFIGRATQALADLDLVVVLPRDGLPLVADGVRSTNPWVQFHFDTLLDAMVRRAGDRVAVLRIATDCVDLEARIEAVRAALAHGGRAGQRPG